MNLTLKLNIKRFISLLALLCFAAPFVVGHDIVAESGDSLRIRRAVDLTTRGVTLAKLHSDRDAAIVLFAEAIAIDSTYAPAYYSMMSQLRLSVGGLDSAERYAKRAYELDTTNKWYLEGYAEVALSKGGYAAAAELYERLLAIDERNLNAYRILAILRQQEGDFSGAVALLDSAEMKAGRNVYLARLKQAILLESGANGVAVEQAKAVVAESPYDMSERLNLANLYSSVGADSLATVEFERTLAMDSTNFEALLSYGSFLENKGRGARYLEIIGRIVMLDEDVDDGYVSLDAKIELVGDALSNRAMYNAHEYVVDEMVDYLNGRYPKDDDVLRLHLKRLILKRDMEQVLTTLKLRLVDDVQELQDAAEVESQYSYLMSIVDLERHNEQLDSVVYYMGRAVALRSKDVDLRAEYSRYLMMQKSFDKALHELSAARKVAAADSVLSVLWSLEGDYIGYIINEKSLEDSPESEVKKSYKKLFKVYKNALKYDEDNASVLNNYAYTLAVQQQDSKRSVEKSLQMAQRVMELEPNNATYIDTHGWVLYLFGRYEEAKEELRRALAFDRDDNYEIALHYAEVLLVLDDAVMAEFYYKRAEEWGATQEEVLESNERAKKYIDED